MTKSTSTSTATTAIITGIIAASITYGYQRMRMTRLSERLRDQQQAKVENESTIHGLKEQRQAERRGRIKAEVKLRIVMKDHEEKRVASASAFYASNDTSIPSTDTDASGGIVETDRPTTLLTSSTIPTPTHAMLLRCIGTIVSPFTKRMGTPRQGALAPHSRGYLQLDPSIAPMETLSGIELFSHAWIVFQFHANTDTADSRKTKIRPPRAGGLKVGTMASRSPHRPNAIGLSLVKVVGVDVKRKRLYVAALDLVNGTPVYDVKPVVPWDIPGHFPNTPTLTVPTWVSQEDTLPHVTFTSSAEQSLAQCLHSNHLAPLYTTTNNNNIHNGTNDEFQCAREAIREVLAQDPRAVKRRGTVEGRVADPYRVVFARVRLEFVVVGEGTVEVVEVGIVEGDGVGRVDGVPFSEDGTMAL